MADQPVTGWSARRAVLLYAALFLVLTFPFWLQGDVIAPYGQGRDIGSPQPHDASRIENEKFFDYVRIFVPELETQLHGKRSGWLAAWSDENELGKPVDAPMTAYTPFWLLTKIIDNPWRILTVFALGTCFLGGLFVLLWCVELGLSPLAGLIAAAGFAASPPLLYWLTVPYFLSSFCWSVATLYGMARLARERSLVGWSVLAFAVFSLLTSAYQQDVVYHAYLFVGYLAVLTYRQWKSRGRRSTAAYLLAVVSAIVAGGLLALPTNIDLAVSALDSARLGVEAPFYSMYLPDTQSTGALARLMAVVTLPEIFGNPISPSYPLPYDGNSVPVLLTFLVLCGMIGRPRKTWGWWVGIVVPLLLALVHPIHELAVSYLGFNLSPVDPTPYALIPLVVVAAYGADALIRRSGAHRYSWLVASFVALLVTAVGVAALAGRAGGLQVDRANLAMTLLVLGLLAAQIDRARPVLLVAALVVTGVYVSFPLMRLRQSSAPQPTSSPLVDTIRANLAPESRFAVASPGLGVLLPNVNATLGLPSLHSYNSISSRRFQRLIESLGGEVRNHGQWSTSIAPDYAGAPFWMSNVGLMLAPSKLEDDNLEYLGETDRVHFHRVRDRMGCCLQIRYEHDDSTEGVEVPDPRVATVYRAVKTEDRGDLLTVEVPDPSRSLLVLSQRFHRFWKAQALGTTGWIEAKAVPVNGVFQGVLLAEGTRAVRLRFLPFSRLAWLAHLFWLALATMSLWLWARRRGAAAHETLAIGAG